MKQLRGVRNHALACCVAGVLTCSAAGAQPASTPGRYEVITGTICRVDAAGGTFDVLTGVGHSLRAIRIHFRTNLPVKSGRVDVGTVALVLGTVCRVECEHAASGDTATGVEILSTQQQRTR